MRVFRDCIKCGAEFSRIEHARLIPDFPLEVEPPAWCDSCLDKMGKTKIVSTPRESGSPFERLMRTAEGEKNE